MVPRFRARDAARVAVASAALPLGARGAGVCTLGPRERDLAQRAGRRRARSWRRSRACLEQVPSLAFDLFDASLYACWEELASTATGEAAESSQRAMTNSVIGACCGVSAASLDEASLDEAVASQVDAEILRAENARLTEALASHGDDDALRARCAELERLIGTASVATLCALASRRAM